MSDGKQRRHSTGTVCPPSPLNGPSPALDSPPDLSLPLNATRRIRRHHSDEGRYPVVIKQSSQPGHLILDTIEIKYSEANGTTGYDSDSELDITFDDENVDDVNFNFRLSAYSSDSHTHTHTHTQGWLADDDTHGSHKFDPSPILQCALRRASCVSTVADMDVTSTPNE